MVICLATSAALDAARGPHSGKGNGERGLVRRLLAGLSPAMKCSPMPFVATISWRPSSTRKFPMRLRCAKPGSAGCAELPDAADKRKTAVGSSAGLQLDPAAHKAGRLQCRRGPARPELQAQCNCGWSGARGGLSATKDCGPLFTLIAQCKVGHRPGRIKPRMQKRRPKPYP